VFACGIKEIISFRGETSFVRRVDGESIRPSMSFENGWNIVRGARIVIPGREYRTLR